MKNVNSKQSKTAKAIFNESQVEIESIKVDHLPSHISTSIQRGISQFEDGQSISLEEFTQRHLLEE